ncbi:MAG: phosphodiesterase [Verrucomicrobiales bacterium]|nr:phosphodiesterase [Verrucomicrobiales bacterium]
MIKRLRSLWQRSRANRSRRLARLRDYWRDHSSRRRFIKGAALTAGGTGVATAGYMRLWEPGWIEVNRYTVPLGTPRQPVRLLHLSDLHASRVVSLGFLRRAFELALEEYRPELICITGDFITWKYRRYDDYAKTLALLSEAAPAFACLGNHDGGEWAASHLGYPDTNHVRSLLKNAGITLLHNASTAVAIGGRHLNLVGVGDPWNNQCDPDIAFAAPPRPDADTLVLSHNPDTKDILKPFDWQLALCGHTHGGQVWVPGIGAPFAPVRDKRFVRGLHQWNNRWLHITKGVGNLHGVRLNCRPEVSLLTLA